MMHKPIIGHDCGKWTSLYPKDSTITKQIVICYELGMPLRMNNLRAKIMEIYSIQD